MHLYGNPCKEGCGRYTKTQNGICQICNNFQSRLLRVRGNSRVLKLPRKPMTVFEEKAEIAKNNERRWNLSDADLKRLNYGDYPDDEY